MAAWHEQDF